MKHQCVNVMLLLDLSAAFDMVDHSVLVNVLKNKYGINDVTLSWFKNYLQDCRFHVVVEDMISQERTMNYSVPQGSLLGPVLFNCCCSTLHEEIPKPLQLNGYADDHSMEMSFKPGTVQESDSKSLLENSMLQTESWMHSNRLKLNPKKTEFILFGSKVQLSRCDMNMVKVCNNNVVRSKLVLYLGAWYDDNKNLSHHVIIKCKVVALKLSKIRLV